MRSAILLVVAACTDAASPAPLPPLAPASRTVGVAYGEGRFISLQHHPSVSGFSVMSLAASTDGETWHEVARSLEHGAAFGGVAFENGRFVAVASELVVAANIERRASAFTSTDGETWTVAGTPPQSVSSIASIDGRFVAASDDGLATSSDGATWTAVPHSENRWWAPQIRRAGDRLYVYGEGPAVFETSDARTWAATDTGLTVVTTIGDVAGRTRGFGLYDCCFGEEPDGITHLAMMREATTWSFAETTLENVQALLDVGPHAVVVASDTLATTVDGETFVVRGAAAGAYRPSFATDGDGTIVLAGGAGRVSHDNGLSWAPLP